MQIQQAVRFGLFHILQAGARAEQRPIPAKGLTGTGYDGHTFWDTEAFVLPVLTYTHPSAAADALRWRAMTLDTARAHAAELGLAGAAFAWRTIHGEECSGYWPAGTAAFHINADIAAAVVNYLDATEDEEFEREVGLPILVETARLWRSLGQHDANGQFRIEGVTGPDEYSAIKDNNLYTNLMAQHNLAAAADLVEKRQFEARDLGVSTEEAASWRDAAEDMFIPFDESLQVHPQHDGFTKYARWDFKGTPEDHYPLLLHYPYFQLYRKQVVKQADVVLAMQMRPEAFTPEQKLRNFDYYEAITVRDSSLSPVHPGGHGRRGRPPQPRLRLPGRGRLHGPAGPRAQHEGRPAHRLPRRRVDRPGRRLRRDADGRGQLCFSPKLPPGIVGLSFRMRFRGRTVLVAVHGHAATYSLLAGEPLDITHYGEPATVSDKELTLDVPAIVQPPPPTQPSGRVPQPHRARSS